MINGQVPLCAACGNVRTDYSRACEHCAQLSQIAITMAPTTIFTAREILDTLQKIVKIGASIDAAQQVVKTAMNTNTHCIALADEIVAGYHREQRRKR